MLNLILVRHGLTDWNESGYLMGRADIPLNARGRAQADALGKALRDLPLRSLLSSPQRRAQETAAVIAAAHDLSVQTTDALAEVWIGRWQGRRWADLRGDADLESYLKDPMHTCDAIEPAVDVERRMVAVVERLRAQAQHGTVALVSHGDPIRMLLAHYLAMPLGLFRRLEVTTGSLSALGLDGATGVRLVALNWLPAGSLELLLARE